MDFYLGFLPKASKISSDFGRLCNARVQVVSTVKYLSFVQWLYFTRVFAVDMMCSCKETVEIVEMI